jgi:peptidyl-tRNA hydrolase, PTH2 family
MHLATGSMKCPLEVRAATKQVIVIRRDLGMRRGKEIAQGAHASLAWLTRRMRQRAWTLRATDDLTRDKCYMAYLSPAEQAWLESSFAKITCQVRSEQELLQLYAEAVDAGLEAQLIQDAGRTEFHGHPTFTALAIGPDFSDKIDKVTGNLQLY